MDSLIKELDAICIDIMKSPKDIKKHVLRAYALGASQEKQKILKIIQEKS